MVYYVDKIQDLETEIGRLRSLRSSDKLKHLKEGEEDGVEAAEKNDVFLTQNETNGVGNLLNKASDLGLTTIFNPAPMTTDVLLAVDVDAAVGAVAKLRAPAMALHGIGHEQTSVGRTQWCACH